MDAHLPNFSINQCSTQKTRDIKWTQISAMSSLTNALPRKLVILNGRKICLMSALINALPRKLVTLNGRTFD